MEAGTAIVNGESSYDDETEDRHWEAKGMMKFVVLKQPCILFGLNSKNELTWGFKICWYIVGYEYKWMKIISSYLGTWLYSTQEKEFGLLGYSGKHDYTVRTRSLREVQYVIVSS